MNAPFYQLDAFGYPVAMALATLLGMGFGFVLERAGFGRSNVLAAQFYGRDMRVLKVMFAAIATTAVGLALLGGIGWVDLAALKIPETWLWPQIVGGLVLGAGFVMAGYCPGTAVVATGSGYVDGVLTLVGVMLGSLLFGFAYPALAGFYQSSSMGVVTLPSLLHVSWAWVSAAVVALAVGSFLFAEWVERALARKDGGVPPADNPTTRNRVFGALAMTAGLALATLLLPGPRVSPVALRSTPISATELGKQLAGDSSSLYLVDTRAPAACAKARIPGALCLTDDKLFTDLPATRPLVLYSAGDLAALPKGAGSFKGKLRVLEGGYAAWDATVIQPPPPPREPTAAAVSTYRTRAALHAHFTGANAPAAPAPAVAPKAVTRSVKKGGGC